MCLYFLYSGKMIQTLAFIPKISRSGASWIAAWLREHPDVAVVQETYLERLGYETV